MSDDPNKGGKSGDIPQANSNTADLARQRALADALALQNRVAKPQPRQAAAATGTSGPALAGEGVADTAELLRLLSALKQSEATSGMQERTIVIGEFSVLASRVPEIFLAGLQGLTRAESAVLRMLGWGRSNADIGLLLDSSENTVRTHMNNVIRKLELDGMRELMCLAGLLFHPLD